MKVEKETEIDERYFRSFSLIYTFHPACWKQVVSMRVNTIWRGDENHRKKKQFCNFPLLKGAFQLVGRQLFSVHDLEMITLTSFLFLVIDWKWGQLNTGSCRLLNQIYHPASGKIIIVIFRYKWSKVVPHSGTFLRWPVSLDLPLLNFQVASPKGLLELWGWQVHGTCHF